jgi:5-methylcytosine-specific restriction enzyme A
MAFSPLYPCRHYACKELLSIRGFCEIHIKDASGWNKSSRKSATERGYGWEWTKLRKQIMQRDNGLCRPCLARHLVIYATEVDHIVPKSKGGTDAESNLQAICKKCHQLKTNKEGRA